MTPQGRSSPQYGDRNGPAVIVIRDRHWSTTSVSRETTEHRWFAVWKRIDV